MRLDIPHPECAKCGKPVDCVIRWTDNATMRIYFTVTCHGEKETSFLEDSEILQANKIHFSKAFTAERLPA